MTPNPDYLRQVNRAIDYVVTHVGQPLRLADVAKVAGFSPFHFHRVFRALTGETLANFTKRVRLQRALYRLAHDPPRSLTELALECGFSSSSDFSRAFKKRYGVPPSGFDIDVFREHRRDDMVDALTEPDTRHLLQRLPAGENPDGFEVELRSLAARTVAYIRVLRPYANMEVVEGAKRLVEWADARGLGDGQWLGYTWDDPEIVPLDDCRYDVAVEVPADVAVDGEVGRLQFQPMLVAELSIEGAIDLEQRGLDWLYRTWLPASGYVPAPQPCFEAWNGRPFADGLERFSLRLHLPVARASGFGSSP